MRIRVTLIALTPLLIGCASIESIIKDQRIYGGVRNNAYYISTAYGDPMPAPDNLLVAYLTWNRDFGRELSRTFGPLFILDMPLSLVLDTVLLPVTVTTWLVRSDSTPVQLHDEGAPLGNIGEPESD
ncbi:MAG: YceK/YidQ family lipoprotein [bacterium]|nr:YceK/YidQ family lipoprotein [bacterium]